MRSMKRMIGAMLTLAVLSLSTGCTFDDGWRDGVLKGTSSAVQAFIKAPIDQIIAQLFPK